MRGLRSGLAIAVGPGIDVAVAEIEKRNARYSLLVRLDVGVNGIQKFDVVWLQTFVGLRGFRDADRAQDVQTQPEVCLSCFVLLANRFRLMLQVPFFGSLWSKCWL